MAFNSIYDFKVSMFALNNGSEMMMVREVPTLELNLIEEFMVAMLQEPYLLKVRVGNLTMEDGIVIKYRDYLVPVCFDLWGNGDFKI